MILRKSQLESKTIDELLELETILLEHRAEDKPSAIFQLINLYRVLLWKIRRDNTYSYLDEKVKKDLVKHYIWYGTYLKTIDRRDFRVAADSLRSALKLNRDIPIAHYRLGFLAYRYKDYSKALVHFETAIELNKRSLESEYKLNELQHYYAHLYLTNSALYIAQFTHESLDEMENEEYEKLPNYEISPFYNIIAANEAYLSKNTYTAVTREGKRYCTKEEAEDLTEMKNTLICYFGDHENAVFYNGNSKTLSMNQAEMLRYILLYGTEKRPATKMDMENIFERKNPDQELANNTFYQAIGRLKSRLESINFSVETIQSKRIDDLTGYFCTGKEPYCIIHRSDADFLLDW